MAIPADFGAIDSPDGTLNKDDDHVNQIQNGRQWPHQRGAMLRILKRSTTTPADFDAIDSPGGTLNKNDDYVDQIQNLDIAGLGTKNNEAIDEDELLSGLSKAQSRLLFLMASRGAGSRPYFRTLRGDPEMIPLSKKLNRMLLRSSKRSLYQLHSSIENELFPKASKGGLRLIHLRYSKPMVPIEDIFNLLYNKER